MVDKNLPVNSLWLIYMNLGDRLKEERERLGLSQPAFAAVANAKKHAQINWEKGVATPNGAALQAWAGIGVDVLYVITGQRAVAAEQNPRERALLDNYRQSKEEDKAAIERVALNAASAEQEGVIDGKKAVRG